MTLFVVCVEMACLGTVTLFLVCTEVVYLDIIMTLFSVGYYYFVVVVRWNSWI